jgi:Holliday junction resolvasome RuvABC DNA-binding subunit
VGIDASRALMSLGYPQAEAERAVKSVMDRGEARDVAAIVRAALGILTGR